MNNEIPKPMIALRRKKRGENGEPKATIATTFEEIDEVMRDTYGEIYEGDVEGPNE